MSVVTNIIVIIPCCSDGTDIKKINSKLLHLDGNHYLKQVDQYAGGNKAFETDVYMGAFNYLNVGQFKKWFKATEFTEHNIQLLIQEQDDNNFTIIESSKDEIIQLLQGT